MTANKDDLYTEILVNISAKDIFKNLDKSLNEISGADRSIETTLIYERTNMYLYQNGIIDHNWAELPTVPEFIFKHAGGFEGCGNTDREEFAEHLAGISRLSKYINKALTKVFEHKDSYWEGDFSQEPRVFMLPYYDEFEFKFGIAWKQSNNGSTFVLTPWLLPHLGEEFIVIDLPYYNPYGDDE